MEKEREWELLLSDGERVKWFGKNGLEAAERYEDAHPDKVVLAWRAPKVAIAYLGEIVG